MLVWFIANIPATSLIFISIIFFPCRSFFNNYNFFSILLLQFAFVFCFCLCLSFCLCLLLWFLLLLLPLPLLLFLSLLFPYSHTLLVRGREVWLFKPPDPLLSGSRGTVPFCFKNTVPICDIQKSDKYFLSFSG